MAVAVFPRIANDALHAPGSAHALLMVLLASAAASVLLAGAGLTLRPRHLRQRWYLDFLAMLGIGLLVPVLGPALLLLDLLLFNLLSRRRLPTEAQQLSASPYVPDQARPLGHFGVGGAIHGLKTGSMGTGKSIRALMAIEQQRSARTSEVLFETLGHPDESVRLTAAGLLDRRESRILQMIRRVEKAIETLEPGKTSMLSRLHLQAANLNAEILYLRLAREGMARTYLKRWGNHLDASEAERGNTPEWLISKARWLDQGKLPGSAALYRRAYERGAAPARVVPYIAEQLWERRAYDELRDLATASGIFAGLPVAGAIPEHWSVRP